MLNKKDFVEMMKEQIKTNNELVDEYNEWIKKTSQETKELQQTVALIEKNGKGLRI